MKFPERVSKHVTESSSFRIFSNSIPDHWIIREVTERDYGVDCYIELVNNKNQVTGELISVQLKGTKQVDWTKENYHTHSGINISTTNYWNNFPTPVFIFLIDTTKEETYYCPVKSFVRKNFYEYAKQEKLSYRIYKECQITKENTLSFVQAYFKEKALNEMERHLTTFISHYDQYQDFIRDNVGRDCFMSVESNRILYLKHFYYNLHFLSVHFDIDWNIKSLSEYFKVSQERFGSDSDIYEQQMDEVVNELEKKMLPILLKIREQVTVIEKSYWLIKDITLFNVMINVKDDGRMPFDW